MKTLLTVIAILLVGSIYAQCDFPKDYKGETVKEIVAHKGSLYMIVKGIGFVPYVDSTKSLNIIAYEKTDVGAYAKLACGETVRVQDVLPNYVKEYQEKPNSGGNSISSGGKLIATGALFTFTGAVSTIAIAAIGIDGTESQQNLRLRTYLPLAFTALGSGIMIIGGAKLIKGGNLIQLNSSKRLQLRYQGTGASLHLRF
jgi:hypothetical protein